jgi:xanthine dehydrogenase accessory factor
MHVTVVDDRLDQLSGFPPGTNCVSTPGPAFIRQREWQPSDALLLVSRNHELDREALAAALRTGGFAYLGMIGSRRKVQVVFAALREAGVTDEQLAAVYAPIGLDLGADAPAEIAISVLAEVLMVLRQRSGKSLRTG